MDPREFREFGHRVVDLLSDYFEHIEEKPRFSGRGTNVPDQPL